MTPSTCRRMALVHASIGIDRSHGPDRGNLYVTWSDYSADSPARCRPICAIDNPCSADVYISRSADRGESWSTPRVVHEASLGSSDQYHQWIEVDPETGALYVAYKDTRDDDDRLRTHVYLNRSVDGGETFGAAIRLSSVSSHADNRFQYGDYQGLDVAGGRLYAAWADFRDGFGTSRIYVGRVDFNPLLSSSRARIDFRRTRLGGSKSRRLKLTNLGERPLQLGSLTIAGHPAFRSISARDRCSGARLAPGSSCRLRLAFEPTAIGVASAELIVPELEGGTLVLRIPLAGEGIS